MAFTQLLLDTQVIQTMSPQLTRAALFLAALGLTKQRKEPVIEGKLLPALLLGKLGYTEIGRCRIEPSVCEHC